MITCENCGTQILENTTTCPACGAVVTPAADAPVTDAGAAPESGAVTTPLATAPEGTTSAPAPTATSAAAAAAGAGRTASGTPDGMSSKTKALLIAVVAIAVALGLIFWVAKAKKSHGMTTLTAEDMGVIADTLSPMARQQLSNSPEERKKMTEELKKILALAEEARKEGVADRPEVKHQLEAGRLFVIAQMYVKKQREANAKAEDVMPKPEEIEAFLKEPGQTEEADSYLADLQKAGLIPAEQPITDQDKQEFRQEWGRAQLLAKKGIAAGVDKERATQLQIELQQSLVLSRVYSAQLAKKLEPTEQEIAAKMQEARTKAEDILKRARGGEDFTNLAKEFSDEPGAKQSGGELPWFGRAEPGKPGGMVKPFEDAAFALQKDGDISDIIETDFGYHIIKLLGRRTDKGPDDKPQEQVHASHILIKPQVNDAAANPFAPRKALREQIKDALVQEKEDKAIEEIVKRHDIKVPEDFTVKAPEMPQGMSPHGGMMPPPPTDAPAPEGGREPAPAKKEAAPKKK
ncbi:MAG TPA: peptidylprolyl isomerase [Pyrinomonadaceae bacterium]|jgi:parvulin-like peptidyl-prolyl isomerase|nr:peptidylprolyl isomerase [Pyrinomonadaceae bacterium]